MSEWHRPNGQCSVCLGGAVMAQTFQTDPTRRAGPSHFTSDVGAYSKTEVQLLALNKFRLGCINEAFTYLYQCYKANKYNPYTPKNEHLFNSISRTIMPHKNDPKQFHKDMRKLARDLEKAGY